MDAVDVFDLLSSSLGVIAFGITTFNFYYIATQIKAKEQFPKVINGESDCTNLTESYHELYSEYHRIFFILKNLFYVFVALCALCSYYMIISIVAPNYPELNSLWRLLGRPFIVILAIVTTQVCRTTQLGK